jgi:hypothetical protein
LVAAATGRPVSEIIRLLASQRHLPA